MVSGQRFQHPFRWANTKVAWIYELFITMLGKDLFLVEDVLDLYHGCGAGARVVLITWIIRSEKELSGDADGGYLFVLEDRYSLVEKFNSHPVCLSSLDKLSLSPRLYSLWGNSFKEMK